MSTASIAERVAAGVAWLDANVPNWVTWIRLERLDMSTCIRCVMGQIYGDYVDSPVVDNDELAISLGFLAAHDRGEVISLDSGEWDELGAEYEALTAEWVRVIEERRTQAGATS